MKLQREFLLHAVCALFGNSLQSAQQSYLLITEEVFARAAGVANAHSYSQTRILHTL